MRDSYTDYERAIEELLRRVGSDSSAYSDLLTFQQRLDENIKRSRRYGETSQRKAERAEVIEQLNRISLSELNVEFNQLVKSYSQVPSIAAESQEPDEASEQSTIQAEEILLRAEPCAPSDSPLPPTLIDSATPDSPLPVTSTVGIILSLLVGVLWLLTEWDFESLFGVLEIVIVAITVLAWRIGINRRCDRYIAVALCLLAVVPLAYIIFNLNRSNSPKSESAEENPLQMSTSSYEEIEIGDVKRGTITSADPNCFKFELDERVYIEVIAETLADFGYNLTVTDSTGAELSRTSSALGGIETLSFITPEDAPALICIAGYDSQSRGTYEITLQLDPDEGRVQAVFVRNIQTGQSISDARVIITIEGELFEGFTDSNGYVQLILPSNEGEINVMADDYQNNRQNLTFNNPQTIQLTPED